MAQYEFIIRDGAGAGAASGASPFARTSAGTRNQQNGQGGTFANVAKAYRTSAVVATTKRLINTVAPNEISLVSLRTGSTELQARLQTKYDIAQQGFNIVESAALGFAVGNLPGAIANTVLSLAFQGINVAQNVSRNRTESAIEDVGIQFTRIRAGTSGSRTMAIGSEQ